MERNQTTGIIAALLILLFVYTAVSKWIDFQTFVIQMRMQSLPPVMQQILIYTLPATELVTAALLVFTGTKRYGLYLSALLMFLFTAYVAMVMLHAFERVPCSCGGVLKWMTWEQHLYFNIFFLLLSLSGIYLSNRERRKTAL
ncbi:MauE/DoxX family redox-associated membrane protein [Mucilaginibacter terrae]|uniref:Oxidoreductase n=1 Tax=Mucilaginibacter terrae TaxID=1955052 RepID=A0ABU3GR96_9SPHI|nr:MauE/DoxX family redox-associated membrane protein [Mucilaginibacter terrae]MDT3402303.1 putative oxidoreductase [Mucilaginibacter terrae]